MSALTMPHPSRKPTIWFVKQGGKVYGPFDSARLKKLADANKIRRDSEVTRQLPGPWAKANRVRGLFDDEAGQEPDIEGLSLRSGGSRKSTNPLARLMGSTSSQVGLPERPVGDARWYYREIGGEDDEASGPHTTADMDRLVDKGRVRASTLVLRAGESRWETAFSSGLFLDDPQDDDGDSEKRDAGSGSTAQTDSDGQTSERHQKPSKPRKEQEQPEKILWTAKPSHHANYFKYALCALTAPLILPAYWGIRSFVERDCIRYQITTRRVQIKRGADHKKRRDIALNEVLDARLACPSSLQTTQLCNVELMGADSSRPLAVLEGIPLDQSAFVISLCEAAVHRHIPTQSNARLLADTMAQEAELRRRAELRHQQEQAQLRAKLRAAEQRAHDAEEWAQKLTSQDTASDSWLEKLAAPSVTKIPDWLPPPPRAPKPQKVSGFTGWLLGASKNTRTVLVRGHYRGKSWVKPHKRKIDAS